MESSLGKKDCSIQEFAFEDRSIHEFVFKDRSEAISFITNVYGKGKQLVNVARGGRLIHLKCAFPDCSFRICCRKGKQEDSLFKIIDASTNLSHTVAPNEDNNISGFCGGDKPIGTKELLALPLFTTLRSLQTVQKRSKKDQLSTNATKCLLSLVGGGSGISTDCMKKANSMSKLSIIEHYVSFHYIHPFLELLGSNNKNARFELDRNEKTLQFEKLAFLFPYSVTAMSNCFNVYGVDAAFLDGTDIKGPQRTELRKFVKSLPLRSPLKFKKSFIIGVSGRTLNNNMILFAVCICYSENKETYEWFFRFLSKNGFNMDRFEVTILSDRGAAVLAALNAMYKLAFLKPCPVHIDRNLNSNGFADETCHDLYWEAAKAPSKTEYEIVITKMTGTAKGIKLFKYLNKIDNWQLYKAVERGNILYEFKSDNLIEIVFSWLKEPRAYSTPYFVLYSIIYDNAKLMSDMYNTYINKCKSSAATIKGLTQRAYDLFQENELTVSQLSYKVIDTNPIEEAGVVHNINDNKFRIRNYNVNLSKRTCSCLHWEQSGVPCYHAIKFKKELIKLKRCESYFGKADFYDFCYYERLVAMFQGSESFLSTIPSTDQIEDLLQNNPKKFQLLPVIEVQEEGDKSCISSKRLSSSGDKKKNGKVFKASRKKECKVCGVFLHKSSRHPYSACMRNISRGSKPSGDKTLPELTPLV